MKENVRLRKNNEEYDKQKVEEILKSFDKEKNKIAKEEAMKKINEYKNKQQKLNKEYNDIKDNIEKLILKLKGLNIESQNFASHLNNIQNELLISELDFYPEKKRNKSVSYHKIRTKKNEKGDLITKQIQAFIPKISKKNKKSIKK